MCTEKDTQGKIFRANFSNSEGSHCFYGTDVCNHSNVNCQKDPWAGEMVQQLKAFDTVAEDQNSVPCPTMGNFSCNSSSRCYPYALFWLPEDPAVTCTCV